MSIVHEADLAWTELEGESMRVRRKQLGAAAGGSELGCSLYELPAGEESWPYHYHTANEEALFVLEGEGRIRLAGDSHELAAGDYVALPAAEEGGHRVVNDSSGPLRYLLVSTMHEPDVTVYPDSGKIGVFVGAPPGGDSERPIHGYYRLADTVEYWADE